MELNLNNTLLATDLRLIDHIVGEVKSQGIFDQFRKECIADVDTKPAYQNLRTRVEGSVNSFLDKQIWKPELNKNQLRETLRKHIHEAPYLDAGVERIVDQVVNPKVYSVFMPQIEDVVYKFLGIERPKPREKNGHCSLTDLLPKDLDPVSPESDRNSMKNDSMETEDVSTEIINGNSNRSPVKHETPEDLEENDIKTAENSEATETKSEEYTTINNCTANDSAKLEEKAEEEEEDSPLFEPIDIMNLNESNVSNDSHLSGISELTSHRSRSPDYEYSRDNFDVSNQDSQLSKVSSDSRLSIVTDFGSSNQASNSALDSKEEKIELKNKENHKVIRNFDFESIKSRDNSQEIKDIKSSRNSNTSKENSRDVTDSVKEKDRNSKEEMSKLKSSKDKSSSKDSKSHKDKDRERDSKRKHNSSSSMKSDKPRSKSNGKDKDKVEESRETKDVSSKSKEKSEKSEKTEKKDVPKDVKDLKDLYKEKIRELREKKELTEKEKLGKTSKDTKERKDCLKDRKDSKKDHKSSSSRSTSTSKHDDRTSSKSLKDSKNDKDKSRKDKDRKLDSSSELRRSSNSKRDDKRSKRDSKTDKVDKSDGKNKEKNSKEKDKRRDDKKKLKDDHSSLRKNSSDRRSTDRDGSNGSGGKNTQKSAACSNVTSGKSGSTNLSKENNTPSQSCSETSDDIEDAHLTPLRFDNETESEKKSVESDITLGLTLPLKKRPLPDESSSQDQSKVKKPKFAKNFAEAKRLMKVRKQMEKEKQDPPENDKKAQDSKENDKEVEENVASLPDDERVQIIEVPVEEDDHETDMENQPLWTLEKTSKIILSEGLNFQMKDLSQKQTSGQSKLSQMDSTIRSSLNEIISDENLLERNDGTQNIIRGSDSAEKETEFSQEDEADDNVKEENKEIANETKMLREESLKCANRNVKEINIEEKLREDEESLKRKNKIEKDGTMKIDDDGEKTPVLRKRKIDSEENLLPQTSTPIKINKTNSSEEIGGSVSSPEQDCLYLSSDNTPAQKFSSYMKKLETKEGSNLEQIIEILGGQMVATQSKSMAPPETSQKRSSMSPLSDILLNNTNNNNDGTKAASPEPLQESTRKRKRGRPKKQKPEDATSCSTNLPNGENFVMPLSPESDVSATSDKTSNMKEDKSCDSRQKSKQHYTSDDLYKPRPLFSSSSRRNRRSNQA